MVTNYTPEQQIKPKSIGRVKCYRQYSSGIFQKGDVVGSWGVLKVSLRSGLSSQGVKVCVLRST